MSLTQTVSVSRLLMDDVIDRVPSGVVIDRLLSGHTKYVDQELSWRDAILGVGPVRTLAEHVSAAEGMWDPARVPILTARHVMLGLALEEEVAWQLLNGGLIASMLERWQPGAGTAEEPHRLVWDLLSPAGSLACEQRPLLAAAFGAPPEWQFTDLPGTPSHICWSPDGDSLVVLIGRTLFEIHPDRPPSRLREVDAPVLSLACTHDGVAVLTRDPDGVRLTLPRQTFLHPEKRNGRLAADASIAWVGDDYSAQIWSPPSPEVIELDANMPHVLAVDADGLAGVISTGNIMTIHTINDGKPAPALSNLRHQEAPITFARLNGARAFVVGNVVRNSRFRAVARLSMPTDKVTAVATDRSGRRVALAGGGRLALWSLDQRHRNSGSPIPGLHSDLSDGEDLLEADRDARAIAALLTSRVLQPPLTIGLFGSWGSGKSFLLGRVQQMIERFAAAGPDSGYLSHVRVVKFNAWHYAETNLWASLVDVVLRSIGASRDLLGVADPAEADRTAADAEAAARDAVRQEDEAARTLAAVRRRRKTRSPRLLVGGTVLTLLAITVAAVLLSDRVIGLIAAAGAALTLISGVTAKLRETASDTRRGVSGLWRLLRRPDDEQVVEAARQYAELSRTREEAQARAETLRNRADRVRVASESPSLVDVLDDLLEVTEYRDQLGLVTRTRERFRNIDAAVAETLADGTLDRVVIVIDDLDRCPPEKVVAVLEAVHLLFEFPLFAVILAVDTRWLDQSLRIRYRELLGEPGNPSPSDYLEKIIQVPIQLLPLDETLVRKLIVGLTGVRPDAADVPPALDQPRTTERPLRQPPGLRIARAEGTAPMIADRPRTMRIQRAEPVLINATDAAALTEVAPLIGNTPRTVKRFVNTYRLIKARAADPAEFDKAKEGHLGDHEAVAFLLAVLIGRPQAAGDLFPALSTMPADSTLLAAIENSTADDVTAWVREHPRFGGASTRVYGKWTKEVSRFTFAMRSE